VVAEIGAVLRSNYFFYKQYPRVQISIHFNAWKHDKILSHAEQFYMLKDLQRIVDNVYAYATLFYYCSMTQRVITKIINISYRASMLSAM
jgi:hypothetical protein